jgi:tripartite-type tricarboxylate transporter receptor subunit TctC
MTDLLAATAQASFMVPGNVLQYVKDGGLCLLASANEKHAVGTPGIPTMIESGYPDFVATSWVGFLMPAARLRTSSTGIPH